MNPAERTWFLLCRALGRALRSARYSRTQIVDQDGDLQVRKIRLSYAPLLIRLGDPLMRILDTGVRVLPQEEWEERERLLHERLRGISTRVEPGGTLVIPRLPGETLATLLEDPRLDDAARERAIELAVTALGELHRRGFSHGDAMAENVMIDLAARVAHWFDFETVHDVNRPVGWRRADDVRALLATCLVRTDSRDVGETLDLILDVYGDEDVSRHLSRRYTSVFQRPLAFHLGQARLSLACFRQINCLLMERFGE